MNLSLSKNIPLTKSGLLVLLGALFFLSCKDANELLLDSTDPNAIATNMEVVPVTSSTVKIDSIRTFSREGGENYLLFGKYQDQYLGNVEAYSFTEVEKNSAKIGDTAVYLSLELHLDLKYQIGNISAPQEVYVYPLLENVYDTLTKTENFVSTSVGPPVSSSHINIKSLINFQNDTSDIVRLSLDDAVGKTFFDAIIKATADDKDLTFNTQKQFRNFFKGVRIVGGPNNTAILGSSSANTKLVLKYRPGSSLNSPVTELHFSLSFPFHVNNIKREEGMPDTSSMTFIQSGTGLSTVIDFAEISKLKESVPNAAINKAELVIIPEIASDVPPPNNLFLLYYQNEGLKPTDNSLTLYELGSTIPVPFLNYKAVQNGVLGRQQASNASAYNLSYDRTSKSYRANITSYIEAVIKDKENLFPTKILLYPEAGGHVVNNYSSLLLNPNNTNFIGRYSKDLTVNRAAIKKENIKLKIYYTIVSE